MKYVSHIKSNFIGSIVVQPSKKFITELFANPFAGPTIPPFCFKSLTISKTVRKKSAEPCFLMKLSSLLIFFSHLLNIMVCKLLCLFWCCLRKYHFQPVESISAANSASGTWKQLWARRIVQFPF